MTKDDVLALLQKRERVGQILRDRGLTKGRAEVL